MSDAVMVPRGREWYCGMETNGERAGQMGLWLRYDNAGDCKAAMQAMFAHEDYAAPPPPSVSIDNGSRPQEAVPSEGHDAAAVDWQVLIDGGWRDTPDPDYWRGIGHEVRSLKTGPAVPLTGHARHLTEVPFPNGMRLTIVRENSYDAVTIWSEDGESIFTQACVAPQPADGCSSNEGAE